MIALFWTLSSPVLANFATTPAIFKIDETDDKNLSRTDPDSFGNAAVSHVSLS